MKILNLAIAIIGMVLLSCRNEKIITLQSKEESSVDRNNIIAILDTIARLDREPLIMRDSMSEIYGPESEEAQFYEESFIKH